MRTIIKAEASQIADNLGGGDGIGSAQQGGKMREYLRVYALWLHIIGEVAGVKQQIV